MLLAAIGNIRGNVRALEAALDAIEAMGIQTVLNTGNCAVGGGTINEAIGLLRERHVFSVQGEEDRRLVNFLRKQETLRRKWDPATFELYRQASDVIHSANLEYLRDMPKRREMTLEGIPIVQFHGTPTSQADSLTDDEPDDWFRRARESVNAPMLVFNGGETGFVRAVDDALFVGTGAIAGPGTARYAIINTETTPWRAAFKSAAF